MSKWEQTLSERQQRPPVSAKQVPSEDLTVAAAESPIEELARRLEILLRDSTLPEDNSGRLGAMLETFKKMIFKMLDKTKKTVVIKNNKAEVEEASIGAPTPAEDQSMLGRPRMGWQKRKPEKKADGKGKMESVRSLAEMGKLISLTGPTPKAPSSSDAAKFCKTLERAVAPYVKGKFFKCSVSTRFASIGGMSIDVRYAGTGPKPSDLEWHNAKVSMHLNIDGFDAEGSIGEKLKLQVYTKRGMKTRAKTGKPEQIVKHIVAAIKAAS